MPHSGEIAGIQHNYTVIFYVVVLALDIVDLCISEALHGEGRHSNDKAVDPENILPLHFGMEAYLSNSPPGKDPKILNPVQMDSLIWHAVCIHQWNR